MGTPIYLDWNATAPTWPGVWEAMRPALEAVGNPASAHRAGRQARQLLEDARERVAALLGAEPDEVIFTSGATESNNLAIFGLTGGGDGPRHAPGHILAAAVEHPCIIEPLRRLAESGFDMEWLPVTGRGTVEAAAVRGRVRPDTRLVCLMLANHETGAVQPVRHVAKTLPDHVTLHCDAAQAVGKVPVSFRDLSVTTLSASGHKFGGPTGVGLLLARREARLRPMLLGGHQQRGQRPGTEPVALAVGLAAALEHAVANSEANRTRVTDLRQRLLRKLGCGLTAPRPSDSGAGSPFVINGDPEGLPHTLNLSFPGCRADVLVMSLDLAGVACSTGSACSSGSLLPSPVLRAMGLPDDVIRSAIRLSLGPTLTVAEIDDAAERIAACVNAARGQAA